MQEVSAYKKDGDVFTLAISDIAVYRENAKNEIQTILENVSDNVTRANENELNGH